MTAIASSTNWRARRRPKEPRIQMSSTLLTIAQTRQIQAAAALLSLDQRDEFLRSVAVQLGRFPTDHDVAVVIRDTIGVTPYLGDV